MNQLFTQFSTFLVFCFLIIPFSLVAQTQQSGPWWPHPEWGPDDQSGASNRITPQKMVNALKLVSTGELYELGYVYEQGMPMFGNRSYTMYLPAKGSPGGDNRIVGNEEFLSTQIGQVGTQFDGLGHIGQEIVNENKETRQVFYNGFTSQQMDSPQGLQKLGIEHVKPIITKGLVIDIAGYKGVARLPNGYEVTVEDVLGALDDQGISTDKIQAGDALLFRFGWSSLWEKPDAYNTNPPGIGIEVAKWIAGKQITVIGSDSWATEVVPNPEPDLIFPVHQELLMKNGIFNIENMYLDELVADKVNEFLFIVTPIRFKGATGSPIRPIAIN